ncbi:rRNA-processing protein fcf1 [Bonamia ostreae]|uniref:rRNA-processing protein fcf1 n=1 Tax=Bonamia ostreae TaxID=126728 RepID=A0ABV2AEE3_9EUKA
MAKTKRKFAKVKRRISPRDSRLRKEAPDKKEDQLVRRIEKQSAAMFFSYNTALGPPYRVLLDTNFINFSLKNKLDILPAMTDCLLAQCAVFVTDCVMAELEKLGPKFRMALKFFLLSRIAKDERFERLACSHSGTYADDCLVNRVSTVSDKFTFSTSATSWPLATGTSKDGSGKSPECPSCS